VQKGDFLSFEKKMEQWADPDSTPDIAPAFRDALWSNAWSDPGAFGACFRRLFPVPIQNKKSSPASRKDPPRRSGFLSFIFLIFPPGGVVG